MFYIYRLFIYSVKNWHDWTILFIYFLSFLILRERDSMHRSRGERHRERERERILSTLWAVSAISTEPISTEPHSRINLRKRDIMTWAEIKSPMHNQRSHSGSPDWNHFKMELERPLQRNDLIYLCLPWARTCGLSITATVLSNCMRSQLENRHPNHRTYHCGLFKNIISSWSIYSQK